MANGAGEFVDEDPMTNREIEQTLRMRLPGLSRRDRRLIVASLHQSGLIVFQGETA